MGPHSLVVLNFNIWGLLHVSRRRKERIAGIANELSLCGADIVALQEVWVSADAQRIAEASASGGRLVHSHLFKSGFFGPGLMLLSAYPIVEAAFHPFTAAGDPSKILQGDYYGTKGIGWVRVRIPGTAPSGSGGSWRAAEQEFSHTCIGGGAGAGGAAPEHVEVDVLITHPHANYENLRVGGPQEIGRETELPCFSVPLDVDSGFRISNMVQLGQLAQSLSARPGSRVVVAGDLNNPPDSLEMALLFCLVPCLTDPWMDHHPTEDGWTCDKPGNTWTKSRHSAGIRIDYVLSTMPSLSAKVVSNATMNGLSLSDHEALEVELDVAASPNCRHHSGSRSRAVDVAEIACDPQQVLLAWREAAHCVSRTISGLQLRRWRMNWLAFLLIAVGISVFVWSFWGHPGYGVWEASLHRQLLATQRLEMNKGGGGMPWLAAHNLGADRRLRAFLMASSGGMMIGAGTLVWILACFGHTSQIRALEGTLASASMIY